MLGTKSIRLGRSWTPFVFFGKESKCMEIYVTLLTNVLYKLSLSYKIDVKVALVLEVQMIGLAQV